MDSRRQRGWWVAGGGAGALLIERAQKKSPPLAWERDASGGSWPDGLARCARRNQYISSMADQQAKSDTPNLNSQSNCDNVCSAVNANCIPFNTACYTYGAECCRNASFFFSMHGCKNKIVLLVPYFGI